MANHQICAGWSPQGDYIGFRCGDCDVLALFPWDLRRPDLQFECRSCGAIHKLTSNELVEVEKSKSW